MREGEAPPFDLPTLLQVCDELDDGIVGQLYTVGGANYSSIASLAWR